MMDFVFSEREDGGIFDNRNGVDYHIPVSGSVVKEPPMHIVHIAVEMAPIAKVLFVFSLIDHFTKRLPPVEDKSIPDVFSCYTIT